MYYIDLIIKSLDSVIDALSSIGIIRITFADTRWLDGYRDMQICSFM